MKIANTKIFFLIAIIAISMTFTQKIKAQENEREEKSSFSVTGDIVSNYIWRGIAISPTLNFQPSISYTISNFTIGTWGSSNISGDFKEIDLFMSYSIKGFSISLTDFYMNTNKKYFNFKNETTGHALEIGLSYENKKIPFKILAGTLVYGEDKTIFYDPNETHLNKQNYSTYFELSYTFDLKQSKLNLFAGATPFTGIYGNDFAVVYTGFTASKEIKITDKFSLPLFTTFSFNPQVENYYIILGINL